MGGCTLTKAKGIGRGGKRQGAGRPLSSDEKMQDYEVTLPPSVADYIRALGTPTDHKDRVGNLSDGIRKLAEWHREQIGK